MRSLVVVGMAATSVKAGSTPASASMDSNLSCSSSPPPNPATVTHAPSPARFMATLAAPPGRSFCQVARTTGTGASGEMRSTSPQMYLSSITSPTTSTRALRHPDSTRAIMSGKLAIIGCPRSTATACVMQVASSIHSHRMCPQRMWASWMRAGSVDRNAQANIRKRCHATAALASHGHGEGPQFTRFRQRGADILAVSRGRNPD